MQLRKGQVAVITGAASGIGLALARAAAERGMKLALADIDVPALDLATADLLAAGADAIAVPTDVSDGTAVDALRDAAIDAYGAVHLVCNNAGVGGAGRTWEVPAELWRWILDVNLMSVVHGIRSFVPLLVDQGEGHIVNTASAAGLSPVPGLGPYVVAKHAVVALSENLAGELARTGIGVSVLCPGFVRTRILEYERLAPPELRHIRRPDAEEGPYRQFLADLIEGGLEPTVVADQTLAAVEEGRLYVVTHPDTVDDVRERTRRLMADIGPDDQPGHR